MLVFINEVIYKAINSDFNRNIISSISMFWEREYILSGAGVKQLFYATNNNAPRQPITLNLIHLITHDYNPHNIPKLKRILLSDHSHQNPAPICHHPHHLRSTITQQWCSNNKVRKIGKHGRGVQKRVFAEKLSSLL